MFASELQRAGTPRASAADIFAAVTSVYRRCPRRLSQSSSMIVGHGLLGFRDPHGIRPLVLGRRETPQGNEYMLASESVALDQIGFELMRDVGPGEAVFIDEHGRLLFAAVRAGGAPHAVHLRVRLLRAARLDHRQHLGAQGAAAHGRPARGEDPPHAGPTTTSTS